MGDWVGSGPTVEGVCLGRSADRAPPSADGHEHRIATDRNRIRAKPAGGRGNARASSPDALAAIAARGSAAAALAEPVRLTADGSRALAAAGFAAPLPPPAPGDTDRAGIWAAVAGEG